MNDLIKYFAIKDGKVIPLQYIGVQEWGESRLEMFNIKAPLYNPAEDFFHPTNSTLTRITLEALGWEIR